MSVLAGDILRPARWSRALARHWNGVDLDEVAVVVAGAAGLKGELLPYTRIDGRPAFPLVIVDRAIAVQRLGSSQRPILDRALLRDHASKGFADAPPEAVVLSGFVSVEPFSVAQRHLAGLRTWAPTVAAVPSWRPLDPFSAAVCDFHRHRIYLTDGRRASPLLRAWSGGARRPRKVDAWGRLRDEQMFQLALDSGLVPF